jgi:P27 family predicted phage terminase small subunit
LAVVREKEGNRGHRPIKRPPEVRVGLPRCPSWLDPEAKREWARLLPDLRELGVARVDRGTLASYCQSVAELEYASLVLQTKGRTYKTVSGLVLARPEVAMLHRAVVNIGRLAEQFGFSPVGRMRLGSIESGRVETDVDRWIFGE